LPGGFSTSNIDAPIGVPVGIEFLGRPWNESQLIEIAYAFEQASHSRRLSPMVD
jgi:Asp-tRNA(Asn)/Glu-tRNA(Gln) amidotransferase A subunit family amidase